MFIYRYVTEKTFDAYLWQTVENKQKFISQIMTSKSPVRSCEDVDETALSYAEIKALCAGDPKIKEKMDLDIEVARLRLLKADHQSRQFQLEDQVLKYFPLQIEKYKGYIAGFEADLATLAARPIPEKEFAGMEISGRHYADKDAAGTALLNACKEAAQASHEVDVGYYHGMNMSLSFDAFANLFYLTLHGQMSHRVELGDSALGNLTRIDNALASIPSRMAAAQAELETNLQQMEAAKVEAAKPFPQEEELKSKSARLAELDAALSLEKKESPAPEHESESAPDKSSIREALQTPCRHGQENQKHSWEEER